MKPALRVLDRKKVCFGNFDAAKSVCIDCADMRECSIQRGLHVRMDGVEYVKPTEFHSCLCRISIYHYPNSSRVISRIFPPKGIVNMLKLQHNELIEVAIRRITEEEGQQRYGGLPNNLKRRWK